MNIEIPYVNENNIATIIFAVDQIIFCWYEFSNETRKEVRMTSKQKADKLRQAMRTLADELLHEKEFSVAHRLNNLRLHADIDTLSRLYDILQEN